MDYTRALWRRAAFDWGRLNCCLAVCDHVARVTGRDPAAPWRGTWSTEAEARAIAEAHGGVLGLMRHAMRLAAFPAAAPDHGRPVVCQVGPHEVAGLIAGRRILFLADRGLMEARAPILEAWTL